MILVRSERLEPRLDGRDGGVAEMVSELFGPPFHLFEDTFDAVAIPVSLVSESELESVERLLGRPGVVDEKEDVLDLVLVAELAEELERGPLVSGGATPEERVLSEEAYAEFEPIHGNALPAIPAQVGQNH